MTKLSSGEQNEIFLLYKFITDRKQIAKTREGQIIIATHSPEIVSESIAECVDLTEMTNS